jgi:hypothetical protein
MNTIDYRVGLLPCKIIAWVDIIFFGFCAFMSWRSGQGSVSPLFLAFMGLGIILLLSFSYLLIDDKKISVLAPFSAYELAWEDVIKTEIGSSGTLVFHGIEGKRLVYPPFIFWSGVQKLDMLKFLISELERRQLKPVKSFTADYKLHKNVSISKQRA